MSGSDQGKPSSERHDRTATNAPSQREKAAITDAKGRVLGRALRMTVAVDETGNTMHVGPPHSDTEGYGYRLMDTFGTRSGAFADLELRRLLKAMGPNNATPADQTTINAALAVVDGIKPENEVEAMLAAQMAVTHMLAMQAMSRAHWADMIPEYQTAGNLAIKLSRTFTMQMEALAKLRRGGEQTVRVEHVHVHNGGQAIVGNVTGAGGGGGPLRSQSQPHATDDPRALVLAPSSPVLCEDAERETVPVATGER